MHAFETYQQTDQSLTERIKQAKEIELSEQAESKALKTILNCIDLTTLEGSDNDEIVLNLCSKAKNLHALGPGFPNVAAVCFYPTFAALAKKALENTEIQVASVAGAFPSGQSPIEIKVSEVKFAVDAGADEIDMVISRGKFLEGEYRLVYDEIAAIKAACGKAHLKVILETGELQTVANIRKAAEIAINAGADFIKTSTGKIQPAATPTAMLIMADTVKEYHEATGQKIGLKPAGGISTYDKALHYYQIVELTLGDQWLNNKLFRIGASRLTDSVVDRLKSLPQ